MTCSYLLSLLAASLVDATTPSAEPALPESQAGLRAFVLEVARRSRGPGSRSDEFDRHYDYVHVEVTEERRLNGELRSREVKRVHHQSASSGTAPGSGHPEGSPSPPPPDTSPAEDKEVSREDFQVTEELLSRFDFAVLAQERVNGRRQHVMDFTPTQGDLPVRDFKDKYINQTAGRLWVDVETKVLTRLQMRLLRPVHVWGGLLGAIHQFQFELERHRTPEDLWYVRHVRWQLKGRKLFVSKLVDFHEERTDVVRAR